MSGPSRRTARTRGGARRRRGLTLAETLVATVVLGAGVAVTGAALASTLRAEARAADLERAAGHAANLLARLAAGALPLSDASGDLAADGDAAWTWSVTVRQGALDSLRDVTVVVGWERGGVAQDLTVARTYFVDPEAPPQ